MKRLTIVIIALFAGAACGGGSGDTQVAADTLTQAQRDSIIAELPIPGGAGLGAARRAVEQANARTERHDTMR
ncbi:MAG: hypothetical protein VX815_09150 [Gemmatimonadota bacterium]|jgi:hypothetical protein|nr:hypothetical protein [Gemmatimonadota bacterium]